MNDFNSKDGRKTTAYILLAVAAYILLSNTGLLEIFGIGNLIRWAFRTLFSFIPAAVLLLGIYWLIQSKDEEKPVIAWFLTLFGAVLVLSQLDLFGLSLGDMVIPMWLVLIAFVMMNPRRLLPRSMNKQNDELEDDEGRIKLVAFMGGGELNYTSQSLTGGEIIAICGGYKIDFTDADMEDDYMELNLMCIMGGVEIIVPMNWTVEKTGAVCIMGGYSVKTKNLAHELELPEKTLVLKGVAFMGGGEIKN